MKTTLKQRIAMKAYASRPNIKVKRKEYMKNYRIEYEIRNSKRISERKRKYYLKNKEKIDNRNKAWIKNNHDKFMAYRKVYDAIHKEKLLNVSRVWYKNVDKNKYRQHKRVWENNKSKNDLNYNMKKRLRIRILRAFKDYSKYGKVMPSDSYGINYKNIINKLMSTLPNDFYEKDYVIDHIRPCCSFDLTNPEEVKACFAPENHQWLTQEENAKKVSSDLKFRLK